MKHTPTVSQDPKFVRHEPAQLQGAGKHATMQILDLRPSTVAQRQVQAAMASSPQVRQVAQLQSMVQQFAQRQAPAFQQNGPEEKSEPVRQIGVQPAHRQPAQLRYIGGSNPHEVLQRQIMHDPPAYNPKSGRAGSVAVENINGIPWGPAANSPSVNPFGWQELWDTGNTLGHADTTHYNAVRMHLWNGRLNGPGNDVRNLAPGPATINSSMSAGPETASKNAVSDGKYIWLKTEVWYQNNSGNANDFTSVVPNRMKMEWGYMLDKNHKIASFFSKGVNRGPAQPPAWDVTIDQPDGAMIDSRKKEFTDLAKLKIGDQANALDILLQNSSNQEIAQAYALLGPDLQKYMLLNYVSIYEGAASTSRRAMLLSLTVVEIQQLMALQHVANYKEAYDEFFIEILDANPVLAPLFQTYSDAERTNLILYSRGDLLNHLGAVGLEIAKEDRYVFNLLGDAAKYNLLDSMSEDEIATLLNDRYDEGLFMDWARFRGNHELEDIRNYVNRRVNRKMQGSFNRAIDWHISQQRTLDSKRPSRRGKVRSIGQYSDRYRYKPY